jgi:cellulose synthase operon protein C
MRGKLDRRFLLLAVVATLVFATGWFFLHRYQKNRRLGEYLVQAGRAEEEKKYDRAARLLRAYVLGAPQDLDARVRYGGLLEKLAKTRRAKADALSVYELVLKQAPDRHDARRRAVELTLEIGKPDPALGHLTYLETAFPADGKVLFLKGICLESKSRYEEAAQSYEKAHRTDPTLTEAYTRRALVLRVNLKREDTVDAAGKKLGPHAVLDELVAAQPNAHESYLARASYLKTYDKVNGLARARADLETARKLAPDQVNVLLASARVAVETAGKETRATDAAADSRSKYWDEARGYLQHGIAKAPKDPLPYLALADVETRAGRRGEAIKVLRIARKVVPSDAQTEVLFVLAEQCAEIGDRAGADDALTALKKARQDTTRIDFLRGLSLVRLGQWYEGSGVLERVRPLLATKQDKTVQIDLLLAECYGHLGDIDRQLITYRRAVGAAPLDYRPRLGLAGALVALGRGNEAIDEYRHISQMDRSPTAAWLALARLTVYRNLTRPESDRQWREVDHLLTELKKVLKEAIEIPLLEAEVLVAKGDSAGAKKLLTERRDARPAEPEFWCALAALTDRDGDNKAAHAILDEAVNKIGDTVELRVARLRITSYTSVEQALGVLNGLADGLDRFPPGERVRLLRALASAYWSIDRPTEAGRLWAQVATLRPTELHVRLLQFDVALKLNDEAGMKSLLKKISELEGGAGPLERYGEASLRIWHVKGNDKSRLPEARSLLAAAAARRPGWARIPLALARIDDIEGNPERVIEHLKQAVELGDRQLSSTRRLVQLLFERQRYTEADDILRRLHAQSPISNDLQRLAAEVSLRLDADRALALARGAVNPNSADYKERLWLAQIQSAVGKADAAEKEFEQVATIAPNEPDVWVAYVQHAARRRAKEPAKAEEILKRAEEKIGSKAPLALAQCYELLGKRDQAEKRYLAAFGANRRDVRVIRATATFYQRGGTPEKAEPFLRELLATDLKAPEQDTAWARRNLALALGARPDGSAYDEAIRLLDLNATTRTTTDPTIAADLRTRAVIVSTRPGRRQEVIALLEQAEKVTPPQPEHEFLLAQLYEAEGNWPKARDRMMRLISLNKDNTAHAAAFVRSWMRRGEYSEAQVWLGRLLDTAPNGAVTVTLQVQLLCRLGKAVDAVPVLRRYAAAKDGTPTDPASRALIAADLFDLAGAAGAGKEAADDAERQYVRYKELSKRPDAALALAGFYARNDLPDKALALCDEAVKQCDLEQVLRAALVAVSGRTAKDVHFAKVEGWLNQALAKKPESDNLRFLVATLREAQGRYGDAEAEYRKIVARTPKHAGALNNLAFLLALREQGPAAVQAVQLATVATAGSPPELLDTRGVVYTAAGDLATARKELEAAVADSAGAAAYFHLAVVLAKQKDKPKAIAALRNAHSAGLRASLLHPLERQTYEKLVAELEKP